ncbi:carbohydrate-binding protein [Cohaesibacter celericrescens]|uniref:Carbohydrate-binding protein n=1 Tax=Cohaesibacter celericrescens TaxID=2067669 RepID=A0A2N5XNB6_9HYPH|nr:carbohydrate-binding protein [Cohaesibacter celericrescens]PLW75918.1 carbohydrate-binding protein [Cohaesibacter celericrescens]
MSITLSVIDASGAILAQNSGNETAFLVYKQTYKTGDVLRVKSTEPGSFVEVCLDHTMQPAMLFLKEGSFDMPVPFGDQKQICSPFAFEGSNHRLIARAVNPETLPKLRNLSLNPCDHYGNLTAFPHATATSQTRGEAAFAASNAIDGELANDDHGVWPYTSWGINQDPDAALTIHFGRPIVMHHIKIFIRADFPHDAWWESARISASDNWTQKVELTKTGQGQLIQLTPHQTDTLIIDQLIKADDPSPFPALTQIEVWGTEIPTSD